MGCNYRNPSVVAVLLDHGADIEAKTDGGSTPLHQAVINEKPSVVAVLLDHGADVEAKTDGRTPLQSAAFFGKPSVVAVLLDHGADIEAKTDGGWTPLHRAVVHGEHRPV